MILFIKVFLLLFGLTIRIYAYEHTEDLDDLAYDTISMASDSIVLMFSLAILVDLVNLYFLRR